MTDRGTGGRTWSRDLHAGRAPSMTDREERAGGRAGFVTDAANRGWAAMSPARRQAAPRWQL